MLMIWNVAIKISIFASWIYSHSPAHTGIVFGHLAHSVYNNDYSKSLKCLYSAFPVYVTINSSKQTTAQFKEDCLLWSECTIEISHPNLYVSRQMLDAKYR